MPNVVRFALDSARNLHVPGVGNFIDGILDVDANNIVVVSRTRYLVQPYRAVEIGVVDSETPPPDLPPAPEDIVTIPDPYAQYLLPGELPAAFNGAVADGDIVLPGGSVVVDDITDASTVGKALVKAASQAAARTAIGAGTSSFTGAYGDLTGSPSIPSVAGLAPYRAGLFTPPTAPVRVVSAMDSGWTHLDTGSATHDTTIFDTGAGSLKITTSGVAGEKSVGWLAFTAQDWSRDAFSFRFRTDAWANIIDGYLLASTSGVLAQFFRVQITPKMARVVNNEWSEVTLTRGDFDFNSGTANWTTVNGLAFQVYGAVGTTPSMWIDQFVRYPTPARATISFANDDGFATTATVMKPALDKHGFRGSAYVMPTAIGTNGYMTQAQVDTLATAGWDIGGHGVNDLTTLSFAAAEADIEATKKYLVDRGYKGGDVYAYPLGGTTFALRTMVAKYFNAARGTSMFGQTRGYLNRRNMMTRQVGTPITLAAAKAWVDRAVAGNEWLIITSHALRATITAEDWTAADFAALVDYVAASGAQVMPVSEALANADQAASFVSPNGTIWRITVGNDGAITTTAS